MTTSPTAGVPVVPEPLMLIGGKLVGAADDRTFDNVNPATEKVLGVAADGSRADADAAIAAARTAFDETSWSRDVGFRLACLRQLVAALERHKEELRALVVAEVGAPVALTHGPQLEAALAILPYTIDLAETYAWQVDHGVRSGPFGGPTQRYVVREPIGVVAAITPWNYPIQINLAKVAPALAAGNTVILKPAPDTPWTGAVLGRIIATETDIPPGVFNVLTTSDNAVAARLTSDPRVDLVTFTGSTEVGRKIMAAGAPTIKKVFLELGGKSAHVILDDADLDRIIPMATAHVCAHSGQGCAINSRLLVARSRYDQAVEMLAESFRSWPYGDPTDPTKLAGPQISEAQRQRVLALAAKGVEEGARLVVGGGVPEHLPVGYYTEPTLFADVAPDSAIAQREFFGPVMAVIPFDGDDDAVRIANNSIYGLAGAVDSASLERARSVADRLRTGVVNVNGGQFYSPDMPFGGYKQSGLGREMGVPGFEEYLEMKVIAEGA